MSQFNYNIILDNKYKEYNNSRSRSINGIILDNETSMISFNDFTISFFNIYNNNVNVDDNNYNESSYDHGYSSSFVEEIYIKLLSQVLVDNNNDTTNDDNNDDNNKGDNSKSNKVDCLTWIKTGGSVPLNEGIFLSFKIFESIDHSNGCDLDMTTFFKRYSVEFKYFLNILHLFSYISRNPQNRALIITLYGSSFSEILAACIYASIEKLEEHAVYLIDNYEVAVDDNSLKEYAHFLMSMIMCVVQICSNFVVTCEVHEYQSLNSPLSWKMLQKMGFDLHDCQCRASENFQFISYFGPKNYVNLSYAVECNKEYQSVLQVVSSELVSRRIVVLFMSLLRKICPLIQSLKQQCDKNPNSEQWNMWNYCVILQIELLSALEHCFLYQHASTLQFYIECAGSNILQSILSMQDVPLTLSQNRTDLVYARALLCLRLNNKVRTLDAQNEIMLVIDAAEHFLDWLFSISMTWTLPESFKTISCSSFKNISPEFSLDIDPLADSYYFTVTDIGKSYELKRKQQQSKGKENYLLTKIMEDNMISSKPIPSNDSMIMNDHHSLMCKYLFEVLYCSTLLEFVGSKSSKSSYLSCVIRSISKSIELKRDISNKFPTMQLFMLMFIMRCLISYGDDSVSVCLKESLLLNILSSPYFIVDNILNDSTGELNISINQSADGSDIFNVLWTRNSSNCCNSDLYFSMILLQDMLFELLWIIMLSLKSQTDQSMLVAETQMITNLLSMQCTDVTAIQSIRWFHNFAALMEEENLSFGEWSTPLSRCLSVSKVYCWKLEKKDEQVFSYNDESLLSLTTRPFLWPARVTCMEYTARMICDPYYGSELIKVFLPKLQDRGTSVTNAVKHLTLIQHFGDPYFRDISLNVVMSLIEKCVRKILGEGSENSAIILKSNQDTNKVVDDEKLLCEALIHDIIKRIFEVMKKAHNSVTDVLETTIMVFERISCLVLLSSDSFIFQRLLENYGTCNQEHELFSWKHTRPHICKELLVNVEYLLKRSAERDDKIKLEMLRTTLEFLKNFMVGNDITKQSFKFAMIQGNKSTASKLIEYGDVFNLIFAVENIPSMKTILLLIDMLLDGKLTIYESSNFLETGLFLNSENCVPIIRNFNALHILVHLVPYCDLPMQIFLMNTFYNLLNGRYALVNLSKCSQAQPHIIDLILDIFPKVTYEIQERASRLLKIVGKHSISVSQLKRIFRQMKVSGDTRPLYISLLLEALLGMIPNSPVCGPKHFFFLEGENSGLVLPALARWPKTKGFSFSMWFSCSNLKQQRDVIGDEFKDDTINTYKPTLLCMRQSDGIGLEVYLDPQEKSPSSIETVYSLVVVSYSSAKVKATSVEIPFCVPAVDDSWHHLSFSQSPALFRSKSDMIILLDGNSIKDQQPYSKFTDSINSITIGDRDEPWKDDQNNTSFCGQIGAITFFAEAFNEIQLRSIYKLGPEDLGFFNDRLYTKQDGDGSPRSVSDGIVILSQAIMLAYNPGDCSGSYCLDNTPEKNAIKWRNEVLGTNGRKPNSDAVCKLGTYKCTTCDVRDSLDCLGGIEVLLPLFALCQLSIQPEYENEYDHCLELLLKLLFAILRDTGENRFFMDNTGFTLIAHFLEQLDAKFLNQNLVEKLIIDTDNLSWNHKWQDSVIRDIFSDFKLWMLADYSVQEQLISYLVKFSLSQGKERLLSVFTTQKLIDGLNLYTIKSVDHIFDSVKLIRRESYTEESSKTPNRKRSISEYTPRKQSLSDDFNTESSLNQSTDDSCSCMKLKVANMSIVVTPSSYRLNVTQVNILRTYLFKILYAQMIHDNIADGIHSLLQYMMNDDDPYHRIECFSLLLRLISPENRHLQDEILSVFSSRNCFMYIVSIFNDSDMKVRLYALVLISSILHLIINRGNKPISSTNFGNLDSAMLSIPLSSKNVLTLTSEDLISIAIEMEKVHIENAFNGIGVPIKEFEYFASWLQTNLIYLIRSNFFEPNNENTFDLEHDIDTLCQIIFNILYRSMHGKTSKILIIDVLKMYPFNNSENQNVILKHDDIQNSLEEPGIDATDKICLPMLFPAVVELIGSDIFMPSTRSHLITAVSLSLTTYENMDAILSVHGWQNCLLKFVIAEQKRFLLYKDKAQQLCSNEKSTELELWEHRREKARQSFETAIKIICNLNKHAIIAGVQSATNIISCPGKSDHLDRSDLKIKQLLTMFLNEGRVTGIITLKDTMSYVRYHGNNGNLHAKSVGIDILQNIIDIIKDSYEAQQRVKSYEKDELLKRWRSHSKWLVAQEVMEFIIIPPVKPSSDGLQKEDLYFDSPSSKSSRKRSVSEAATPVRLSTIDITSAYDDSVEFLRETYRKSAVNRQSVLFDDETGVHELGEFFDDTSVWLLIDSLLKFIGSMDAYLGAWSPSDDLMRRFKIGMKVGFLLARQVKIQASDSVNSLITSNKGSAFRVGQTSSIVDSPISRSIDNVFWIILRVLLDIFLQGATSITANFESSPPLMALKHLEALFEFIKSKAKDYYEAESLFFIARVSVALKETVHSNGALWVVKALRFLTPLLIRQRIEICSYLDAAAKSSSSVPESPAKLERFKIKTAEQTLIDNAYKKSAELLKDTSNPLLTQVLEFVRYCISLGTDKLINLETLSWPMWDSVISKIIKYGEDTEVTELADRWHRSGAHKHSYEVTKKINNKADASLNFVYHLNLRLSEVGNFANKSETRRLRDLQKIEESQLRQCIDIRNVILEKLTNERGPWGAGVEDPNNILWMVDCTESNNRMRNRLKKNIPIYQQLPSSSTSTTSTSSSSSSLTTSEVWKDLMKYKNKDLVNYEDTGENENDDNENDNDDNDVNSDSVLKPIGGEKIVFSSNCEIITPARNTVPKLFGVVEITKSNLTFTRSSGDLTSLAVCCGSNINCIDKQNSKSSPQVSLWHTHDIIDVARRNFQSRFVAIEIFFSSRTTLFLNLYEAKIADKFQKVIRGIVKPTNIAPFLGTFPSTIVNKTLVNGIPLTMAWQNREISNFEYLMRLNTIAGRTYNDLGQYPVFPWILADYSSSKLNLKDKATFRNLEWPLGAQTEEQREAIRAKYADLESNYNEFDGNQIQLPPFHFGSHYSLPGFVLWYLLRIEPYTSFHLSLQGGKFDLPDRLFHSLQSAWKGITSNTSDVKELIPEMFCLPDILENRNHLNLGQSENGEYLAHVELPPWAKDAHDFIYQHQEALESEYVSSNLHHWIDLIFGFKQLPPHIPGGSQAALDACNVYVHLTYPDAINLDEVKKQNEKLYNIYISQISEYGQAPAQLFKKPHPQRIPIQKADIVWPIASMVRGVHTVIEDNDSEKDGSKQKVTKPSPNLLCYKHTLVSNYPIVFIAECNDRLITIDTARTNSIHTWQHLPPEQTPPYKLKFAGSTTKSSSTSSVLTQAKSTAAIIRPYFTSTKCTFFDFNDTVIELSGQTWRPQIKDSYIRHEAKKELKRMSLQATEDRGLSIVTDDQSKSLKSSSRKEPNRSNTRNSQYISDESMSSIMFAVSCEGKLLFSCGHWDCSIRVYSTENGRLLQSIIEHSDIVTSVAVATDGSRNWLATGSRDCTVKIWDIMVDKDSPLGRPSYILYGHDDIVTCVDICPQLDIVVTGSIDGTIIIHELRKGLYLRSIIVASALEFPNNSSSSKPCDYDGLNFHDHVKVTWVGISHCGFVVIYSDDDRVLYTYSINGHLMATKYLNEKLYAFKISEDGNVLVAGGDAALVTMRWIRNLALADDGPKYGLPAVIDGHNTEMEVCPFDAPIRSIELTKNERHLIVGLESGDFRVLTIDPEYLRKRLKNKLFNLGIL